MELTVLLSESASRGNITDAKSYVQAERMFSGDEASVVALTSKAVGLTVTDAGVFQTGKKEGLYYLVGSKAFALGTVDSIVSLARKRLDGKFVVWEATEDGLPGKAPASVLTFTKWADALRNFLGRATGAAIASEPAPGVDASLKLFTDLGAAKSIKAKQRLVFDACNIDTGKVAKVSFDTDDDTGLPIALVSDSKGVEYGLGVVELGVSAKSASLTRLSDSKILATGAAALIEFGKIVNSGTYFEGALQFNTSPAEINADHTIEALNQAKSKKEMVTIITNACQLKSGKASKLNFEKDDDSGDSIVQFSVPDATRGEEYGPVMYGLERLTKYTFNDFTTDLPLGTLVLVRIGEHLEIVASGKDALAKFGQIVNSGVDAFAPAAQASDEPEFSFDSIHDKIYSLDEDGFGPKVDKYFNKALGTKGLEFHAATNSDDSVIAIDGHMKDNTWFILGTVRSAGSLAAEIGVKATSDTFFATQQDGIIGDNPKLIVDFGSAEAAAKALPRYLAMYAEGKFKTEGAAGSTTYTYSPALYKTMTDILTLNGFKISKSGELSHAAPSAFKNSYIETILNDVMLGSRNETTPTGENLLHVYAGYDTAGFIDVANKRIYKEYPSAPVKKTGPISLDDLAGGPSTTPGKPDAATAEDVKASAKIKINSEIALSDSTFEWLQGDVRKVNSAGGIYSTKSPIAKSHEIATYIYGNAAPVKRVLKSAVFSFMTVGEGTCLTVSPMKEFKAGRNRYATFLVSRDDQPKIFRSAMAGAKFALVTAKVAPDGTVQGRASLIGKARNMREGMQLMMYLQQKATA